MRRPLTIAAAGAAALLLAAPAAQASTTKYTFEDVTFPNGQTGTIHASTKIMKKKPDNVYCNYQTADWENLGSYLDFVEPAPTDPQGVLRFCLDNFDERH